MKMLSSKFPPLPFQVLVPAVINAVSDPFYKISSEALLVLETLVTVLRPMDKTKVGRRSLDLGERKDIFETLSPSERS